MSKVEQTLSLIKPDAVERNLEEEIKQFFIKSGFQISKQKKVKLEKKMLKFSIKYMKQNLFIMTFAIIFLLDLLLQ